MHLEEDNEEIIDGGDDEDVLMELSTLIVTRVDKGGLPIGYKSLGNGIVYDKAWDETAELLVINEVKESSKEKIGISADKIKSSEVGEGQVEGSEVGESEVAKSETEENDTEESDHFEACN